MSFLAQTQTRTTGGGGGGGGGGFRPDASSSFAQTQQRLPSAASASPSSAAASSFHLPLASLKGATGTAAASMARGPSASPSKPQQQASGASNSVVNFSPARASKPNKASSSSPSAQVAAGWYPYGAQKLAESDAAAARTAAAGSTRVAQALQAVRSLDRDPREQAQSRIGYPLGAQEVPKNGLPYVGASRPSSASVTLPPLGAASPASSSSFNRTQPLSSPSSSASSSVINRPVAGVDDPLLHATVHCSATGQSFAFGSQRLADLAASKHARHFAAWETFQSARTELHKSLNAQVESLCESLRLRCDELERPIRVLLFETMSDDAKLVAMDSAQIEAERRGFESNYAQKSSEIHAALRALDDLESSRGIEGTRLLERLLHAWFEAAHMPQAEMERQAAEETKELNLHMLRNRATTTELGAVLLGELVHKQKEVYARVWEQRYAHWRALRHQWFLDDFHAKFFWDAPEPPVDPNDDEASELQERSYPFQYSLRKRHAFSELSRHGRGFLEWSQEIVLAMLRLTPRSEHEHLRDKVAELAEQLQQGYSLYDTRTDALVQRVQRVEAEIAAQAQSLVAELERNLNEHAGAYPPDQIAAHLSEHVWPLLQARSARETDFLERVRRCMKHADQAFLKSVDCFSAWYTRAAERWEDFRQAVLHTNSSFDESVHHRRDMFDSERDKLEAELDSALALLVHEPSVAELEARLAQVKALVGPEGALEELHRSFYAESRALTEEHPRALKAVCEAQMGAMASHFGLRTPADLAAESLALSQAAMDAARAAAEAEEAQDAQLSKRDLAKKQQGREMAKKEAERLAEKAAEEERRAKLAKIKERAAAQAKEELTRLALAKSAGGSSAAAATAAAEDSGEDPNAAVAAAPSHTRHRSIGGKKRSDAELLAELDAQEAADKALRALESSLATSQRFYDFDRFHSLFLNDSTIVKLAVETPLSELGKVQIQSGELNVPEPVVDENMQAQALMDPESLKQYIVQPLKLRAEAEAREAAEAARLAAASPTKGKSKGRAAAARSPSPAIASASAAGGATPRSARGKEAAAAAAAAAAASAPSTLPYLALPAGVLQFHIFLDQQALLDRMLLGEPKVRAASASASAPSAGSAAAGQAGGEISINLSPPAAAAAATIAAAGDSTSRSGGDLQLSLGGLETSGEAADAATAAAIAEAQAAIAAAASGSPAATAPGSPHLGAEGAPAAASASGSRKLSKKQRAAQAEEDAARAKAEEDRRARVRAEEEARLAALLSLTSAPVDSQGLQTVTPLAFPRTLVARMLELVRESFLCTLQEHALDAQKSCAQHNAGLAMDLLKELNLSLRRHRPRFNRIEVDCFEVRAKSLAANVAAYTRLVERLNTSYGQGVGSWEEVLLRGERDVMLFRRRAADNMDQLRALATDPDASLAQLHAVNTSLKQARLAFTAEMQRGVFDKLARALADFQSQVGAKIRAFIESANTKVFGASGQQQHRYGAATIEELDAEGNPIPGSASADAISPAGSSIECFHPAEIASYARQLSAFESGLATLLAGQHSKVAALRARYESALALQEFNASYALNLSNLSIAQGLGHRNGAPKRSLTVGVRSEFHRSLHQQAFIDSLLAEMEQAAQGKIVVVGAATQAKKKGAAAAEEKQQQANAEEDASSTANDLAAAFSSLTVSLPLSAPRAASAANLTQHVLHTLDQLRHSLLARAQYLAALKAHLPPFVLKPVDISEAAAAARETAAAENARAAAAAEEEALSSGGRSRGGAAGSAIKRQASSSLAAASPDRLAVASAGGADAKGKSPAAASKRMSGRGALLAAEAAAAAAAASDPNSASFPTFVEVVSAHIESCKRDMHALVVAYETTHPDRKVPLALPAAPVAEAKEAEPDAKGGSHKKKASSGGASSEKLSARAKAKADKDKAGSAAAAQQQEVPANAVPPAIEEHCASEYQRALAHMEEAHKALLRQTDQGANVAALVGPVALQDVFRRLVEGELAQGLQQLEGAFLARYSVSQSAAARHRAKLKPSLASRPDASVADLRAREDARWVQSVETIRSYRREVLALLERNGQALTRELLHASSALLTLCDSLVLPLDLSNVLKDGGEVLGGRRGISHLAREARRLRQTKEAVAEQAGMALDELGNLVPKAADAAAATTAGAPRARLGSAGSSHKKKSASALEAERAASESARTAAAELAAKMDPRFLRLTWSGLRVAELELPLPAEEAAERAAKMDAQRRAAEQAAAEAEAAAANMSGPDARKKKRAAAAAAAAAAAKAAAEGGSGDERGSAPGTPTGSPPGSAQGSKRSAASTGAASPTPAASSSASASAAPGGRRTKKQREADEAAAAAAAAADASRALAESAVQTAPVSGLNQPAQRAVVAARNALFAQYVRLYQQQAAALLSSTQQMLDAEDKARREWDTQVQALTNPEPLQF